MELEPVNRPQTVREFRKLLGLLDKPVVNIPTPPPVNYYIQQPINVEPIIPTHGTSLQTPPNNQEVQLKSAVGMNYTKLRDLLKAEKWEEADQETARVMLAVAKREEEGWLDDENIDNFPCEDLRTIDQLWVKHSDGKFGFSVQKRIYNGLGGTRVYNQEIWDKFGDEVGWRKRGIWLYWSDTRTFNMLPISWFIDLITGSFVGLTLREGGKGVGGLFSRVETCKL
jgi:hypothetical protein